MNFRQRRLPAFGEVNPLLKIRISKIFLRDFKVNKKTKTRSGIFLKRWLGLALVFLIFFNFLFFSFPQEAKAQLVDKVLQYAKSGLTYVGDKVTKVASIPSDLASGAVATLVNGLLYVVFVFMGILVIIAGVLFDWAINPDNFMMVMNLKAIYTGWQVVRDFFNLAFILVLLFSAFCTVFQVEKYHLKKILLTLVIMALLVNFSYAIARFIIDVANVTMYYILSTAFPDLGNKTGIVTGIAQFTGIVYDLAPSGLTGLIGKSATVKMLCSIVFLFILASTLLIIGILFLIRIVVLAILVIFSPVGFVAGIFPGTKNYADKWWDQLFKQAFFGVIMSFMLYISIMIMKEMQDTGGIAEKMKLFAGQITGKGANYSEIITTALLMAIPITLLWMGIIVSQQMGAYGAATAKKLGTGAMGKFSGLNAVKRGYKAYQSRRQEAQKSGLATRWGHGLASQQDRLRAVVAERGGIGGGRGARDAKNRYEADRLKAADDAYKSHNMGDMAENELRRIRTDGNADEQAAATRALAEKSTATQADLDNVRQAFGETSQVFRQLANKVKAYDPVAAFAHLAEPQRQANTIDYMNSNQFDSKKLNTHSLGNAEFMELAMGNGSLSVKDINELRKDASKKAVMEKSVGSIVKAGHRNSPASEADRNMHMAHFALTGQIHDDNFSEHIAKNLDDETAKYMQWSSLTSAQQSAIANNIRKSQIRSIAYGIKNDPSAKDFVNYLKTTAGPHQTYVQGHRDLQNF